MYEQYLTQTGLTAGQSTLYEAMLKIGPATAGKIAKITPLKRGLVYKILDELVSLGLAIKKDTPGKVAIFEPAHPLKLKELAEQKEAEVKNAQAAIETILGQLSSEFNLAANKPGVRFYEGLDGVKKALEDTLVSNPEKMLLVFSDAAGYATYLKDWNTNYYAPHRRALKIYEKVIIPNHPIAMDWLKDYKASQITEMLFIDHKLFPFSTEINIYNNKVSFVTISARIHIGVIIEDKEIYETFKSIFNFVWELGRKHPSVTQPSWVQRPTPPVQPPLAPTHETQPKSLV